MRIVVASFEKESNSFSPVPSLWNTYGRKPGPFSGEEAIAEYQNARIGFAALLAAAKSWGAEVDVPIVARCPTAAPMQDSDLERIIQAIEESVRKGCDAIMLDLHGAMLTQSGEDEGLLLERLRQLAPNTPIGVTWDYHGTMNQRKVENTTVSISYKTAPHVDCYETGEHVARVIWAILQGKVKPTTAWGNIPAVGDSSAMTTSAPAMAEIMAMVAEAEKHPKVLACSVFGGSAFCDTPESGPSCVVVTDNDIELAQEICDQIRVALWERREKFVFRSEPLAESVAKAVRVKAAGKLGPYILVDNADSTNAGGTTDDMAVVREVMNQGLTDVIIGPIRDPEVAALMHAAGNGATITVQLGSKLTPVGDEPKEPVQLTGTVSGLYDGDIVVTGPVFTGTRRPVGPSGCLTCNGIQFVITTERVEPFDLGIYEAVGLVPQDKRFLVMKGYGAFIPVCEPFAAEIVRCRGTGAAKTVLEAAGRFKTLRRPVYPLDEDATFELGAQSVQN